MRILGIDSTTPKSSVALVEQNKVLAETHLQPLTKHSNRILALVDQVLAQSGVSLDAVDAFAVTRGPGSFTGLRVGVSLVQGLVLATGKPCIGVDTLEAVAASAGPTHRQICPFLDARKNQIYAAFFKYSDHRLQRTAADCAIEPVQFCEQVTEPTPNPPCFWAMALRLMATCSPETWGLCFSPNRANRAPRLPPA